MKYQEVELIDNKELHNLELWVDGQRSFIDYRLKGDSIYLIHTEVPEEQQGKGIAGALVEKSLHYIEQNQLRLVPLCTYVQRFLQSHRQWYRLVDDNEV